MRFQAMLLASALMAGPALAADPFPTHDIATYTAGAALEGLTTTADGSVILTSNFDNMLLKIVPGGLQPFATLPAHPQVVVATPTGFVVTAHGKLNFKPGTLPFGPPQPGAPPRKMPSFSGLDTQLLVLDHAGHVVKSIAGQADAFFNGLAQGSSLTLIADSIGGKIWSADPAAGTVTPWLSDPLLSPVPPRPFPGANGIKIHKGVVYVSNTTGGAIYTVKIGADGRPDGGLKLLAHVPNPDDFDVAEDGTVFLPSAGAIASISPAGLVTTGAKNCEGCDAAMLQAGEHTLLLVTHLVGKGRVVQAQTGR